MSDTDIDEVKNFGQSVSMDQAGTTVAVSGINTNEDGKFFYCVKVYRLEAGTWSKMGDDITSDNNHVSVYLDDARADASLSGDGLHVAVSSIHISDRDNDSASPEGIVRVYAFNSSDNGSSSWDLLTLELNDIIGTAGGGMGLYLGLQVSLNYDASKIAVGMRYDDLVQTAGSESVDDNTGKVLVCGVGVGGSCTTVSDDAVLQAGDHAGTSVMITHSTTDRSCLIFGSTGSDSNGADSGSASVYCEDLDGTWSRRGNELRGEAAGDEFGLTVAISSDGNYVAVGSAMNDPDPNKKDAGHVRVYKYNEGSTNYEQIGNDIDGERGERNDKESNKYYVGDFSGYSIALSNRRDDNTLRVAIGSPNNAGDDGYYRGHSRLFGVNLDNAIDWVQIADNINGLSDQDSAGSSIAMNADGTRLIVGAPNSGGNVQTSYYRGAAYVIKQTEYSSEPSDVPTLSPSVKPSSKPSVQPSVTPSTKPSFKPSDVPSLSPSVKPSSKPSVQPSVTPSTKPSLIPTSQPSKSISPSSKPSSENDRIFQIITQYNRFDKSDNSKWCLTASDSSHYMSSKLHVRRCDESNLLQLWKTNEKSQLLLASFKDPTCINARSRAMYMDACSDAENEENQVFSFEDAESGNKHILQPRDGTSNDLYAGINPSRKFARVRLYRKSESNDSLEQWSVEYGFEAALQAYFNARMPSSTPSFEPSFKPSSSDPLISRAVDVIGPCAVNLSCDDTATNDAVTWFINSANHPENVDDEQVLKVSIFFDQTISQLVFLFLLLWTGGIRFIILTSIRPITNTLLLLCYNL